MVDYRVRDLLRSGAGFGKDRAAISSNKQISIA